jgi:hypothetical protein
VGRNRNRNDDSAAAQHGGRDREDLERERNEMSDDTSAGGVYIDADGNQYTVVTSSMPVYTGVCTGVLSGVTVSSAGVITGHVAASTPYLVSDMVTAAAILPDAPPPGPRKPVPALPPEVWSEREFDADAAHAATLAMCRGNR